MMNTSYWPGLLFSKLFKFGVVVLITHAAVESRAQTVLFYGGDYDGRGGVLSQSTPAVFGITFDDFTLSQSADIGTIWGNFGLGGQLPTQAYYEIRSGVSAGNGGTLISSGTIGVQLTATGRSQVGSPEYQVLGNINLNLNPGTYWLGIAPIGGFFDGAYISTTSGGSDGTPGDPNPLPTGSPLADGNSYFYDPNGYNYVPVADTTAGPGTWDFSYGVAAVPEPRAWLLLAVGGIALLISRAKQTH